MLAVSDCVESGVLAQRTSIQAAGRVPLLGALLDTLGLLGQNTVVERGVSWLRQKAGLSLEAARGAKFLPWRQLLLHLKFPTKATVSNTLRVLITLLH